MRVEIIPPRGKLRHFLACKIPTRPVALSRSRSAKGHHYNNAKDVAYQNEVYTYLMEEARKAGLGDELPWSQGPVLGRFVFQFKGKGKTLWQAHTRRPDKDNLTKNLLDAISAKDGRSDHHRALLWDDDIVTHTVEAKIFGPEDAIFVQLYFYEEFVGDAELGLMEAQREYEEFIREWSVPDFKGRMPANWEAAAPPTISEVRGREETVVSLKREFHDSRLDRLKPT